MTSTTPIQGLLKLEIPVSCQPQVETSKLHTISSLEVVCRYGRDDSPSPSNGRLTKISCKIQTLHEETVDVCCDQAFGSNKSHQQLHMEKIR